MGSADRRVAWVLGAKGFLGRHVARRLDEEGWRVDGLGRGQWRDHREWGLASWSESDVTTQALSELATAGPPDVVFCATGSGTVAESFSDAQKSYDDTVGSAQIALDFLCSRVPGAIFLYPSSCAVYGIRADEPIDEDSPEKPASPYGAYKLEVERACRQAQRQGSLRCGVIRFFSLYGPGLRKQLIWDFAARAPAGGTIALSGTGSETRDLLHVDDASELVSRAITKLQDGSTELLVINGGSGRALTVREIAERVVQHLPTEVQVVFAGTQRAGDPPHFCADVTRARSIGFEPRWDPEDGIADYCRWITTELWGKGE